jgi:predicted nucleic acid-binding protein
MTVFVDTSMFYAAADAGDSSHARARKTLSEGEEMVTSDHVLVESWILIRHRLGRSAAERYWDAIRRGAVVLELVGQADLQAAWSIGEAFADQDFSIVDRTSFAMMERLGITRAATLDSDFAVYRFGTGRGRAFTIVD